jgi:uncharacterized protein (DUF2267 family)
VADHSKALITVELEYRLIRTINEWGLQQGLSVHQVLGAMTIVEHQLVAKWETDRVKETLPDESERG